MDTSLYRGWCGWGLFLYLWEWCNKAIWFVGPCSCYQDNLRGRVERWRAAHQVQQKRKVLALRRAVSMSKIPMGPSAFSKGASRMEVRPSSLFILLGWSSNSNRLPYKLVHIARFGGEDFGVLEFHLSRILLSWWKVFRGWQFTICVLPMFNLETPNVNYSWRTAPLTSKIAFYILIQQI